MNGSLSFLSSWNEAQSIEFKTQGAGSSEKWIKPPMGWVKCNVEVALFGDSSTVSAMFKNEEGIMIKAYAHSGMAFARPEVVEAVGVREALSWVRDRRRQYALVKMDCLHVVQAIYAGSLNGSTFGLVIDDCKHICQLLLMFELFMLRGPQIWQLIL